MIPTPREVLFALRPRCHVCRKLVDELDVYQLEHRAGMQVIVRCHGDVEVATLDDEVFALLLAGGQPMLGMVDAFVPALGGDAR